MKDLQRVWAVIALLVAGPVFQSAAKADVFSYTYSELEGDFAANGPDSGTFVAVDQAGVLPFQTQGDATRLVPVADSVVFDFTDAGIGFASFDLSITTTAITDDDALALGTLTLADIDGDTITASISGQWIRVGTSANLVAQLTDVTLNNTSQDGTFDGTSGNAWSMTFDAPGGFEGNVIALAFGDWFTDGAGTVRDFNDQDTLASGAVRAIVPEPGTLAILTLGGMAAIRMRRRKTK